MARPRTTRRRDDRVERKPKKRISILDSEQITYVDYKDVNLLRKFMSDRGKIRARRVSGNCAQHQREVALAIKTARELALLPFTQRTTSERPSGRGPGRGGQGGRGPARSESAEEPELEVQVNDTVADVELEDSEADELAPVGAEDEAAEK